MSWDVERPSNMNIWKPEPYHLMDFQAKEKNSDYSSEIMITIISLGSDTVFFDK